MFGKNKTKQNKKTTETHTISAFVVLILEESFLLSYLSEAFCF